MTFNKTWSITTEQRTLEIQPVSKLNSLILLLIHTKVTTECFEKEGVREMYLQAGVDHMAGLLRNWSEFVNWGVFQLEIL